MTKRRVLIAFLLMATLPMVLVAGRHISHRLTVETIANQAETSSTVWLRYFSEQLSGFEILLEGRPLGREELSMLAEARRFVDVFRFILYDGEGRIVILSDDIGPEKLEYTTLAEHNPEAAKVIQSGDPFTRINDGRQKSNRPDFYAESYLPIFREKEVVGVVEVYSDMSADYRTTEASLQKFGMLISALIVAVLAVPGFVILSMWNGLKRSNSALALARDEAVQAQKAKSQFLANMSHEIRSPMTGVLGMADVLAETNLNPEQRELLDTIQRSSSALLDVLNGILDFSKIEAEKITIKAEPFDLRAVIEDVAAVLAPVTNETDVEICTDFELSCPEWVKGDAGRIRQCLTNLVGNAVKFTQSGYVLIVVRCSSNSTITIEVQDTGIGIPEENLEHVFTAFEQVESNYARRFEGTGLGLAITQRLVVLMGGGITLRSEPGRGSTFSMHLPLPVAVPPGPINEPDYSRLAGKFSLVIDNYDVSRRILSKRLESWGIEAYTASSVQEAMHVLEDLRHKGVTLDFAILGSNLPKTPSQELLRQLKTSSGEAAAPAVLLCSSGREFSNASQTKGGIDATILKPFRSKQLATALIRTIGPDQTLMPASPPASRAQARECFLARGLKILLAEDSRANRIVVEKMLAEFDLELVMAEDGAEAVAYYKEFPPDLVLMDLSMPKMTGFSAAKAIRAHEVQNGLPRCPIIAFSANVLEEDHLRSLEAGMDSSIAKPVRKTELVQCLQNAAAGSSNASKAF